MRRNAIPPVALPLAAILLGLLGCQTLPSRFLNLIGLTKEPLAFALALDNRPLAPIEALNPFPSYAALQKALADELGRPVAVDVCFPVQVDLGLSGGLYDIADLTTTQYARLSDPEKLRVLAVPVDQQGRIARSAVLVVAAGAALENVAELRGKTVAFGPADDPRTHHAALRLLERAGLARTDLALEVLPVPGSLKHMPDARSVAQTVINASSDAGFLDEAAWEALPEHAAQAGEPARDQLRAIARTAPVPDRVIVASPKLAADVAEQVRTRLVALREAHPEALEPLGIAGYQTPAAGFPAEWRALILPAEPSATPTDASPPAKEEPLPPNSVAP